MFAYLTIWDISVKETMNSLPNTVMLLTVVQGQLKASAKFSIGEALQLKCKDKDENDGGIFHFVSQLYLFKWTINGKDTDSGGRDGKMTFKHKISTRKYSEKWKSYSLHNLLLTRPTTEKKHSNNLF